MCNQLAVSGFSGFESQQEQAISKCQKHVRIPYFSACSRSMIQKAFKAYLNLKTM